jgi:hypothetical protein
VISCILTKTKLSISFPNNLVSATKIHNSMEKQQHL